MNDNDFAPGNLFVVLQVSRSRVRNRDIFVDDPADLVVEPKATLYSFLFPPEFPTVASFDYRLSPRHIGRGTRAKASDDRMAMNEIDVFSREHASQLGRTV